MIDSPLFLTIENWLVVPSECRETHISPREEPYHVWTEFVPDRDRVFRNPDSHHLPRREEGERACGCHLPCSHSGDWHLHRRVPAYGETEDGTAFRGCTGNGDCIRCEDSASYEGTETGSHQATRRRTDFQPGRGSARRKFLQTRTCP